MTLSLGNIDLLLAHVKSMSLLLIHEHRYENPADYACAMAVYTMYSQDMCHFPKTACLVSSEHQRAVVTSYRQPQSHFVAILSCSQTQENSNISTSGNDCHYIHHHSISAAWSRREPRFLGPHRDIAIDVRSCALHSKLRGCLFCVTCPRQAVFRPSSAVSSDP